MKAGVAAASFINVVLRYRDGMTCQSCSHEQERAAATPAAPASAGATPSTGAEVISLLSDSEDEAVPARSLAGSVRRRHEVVDLEDSDDEAATPTSPKRRRGTDSDDNQSPDVGRRQQVSANQA